MNVNVTVSNKSQTRKALWARHLGALAFLLALIAGLFWEEVSSAVTVWWIYPTYSHCFLVIPIALWLIWEKRHELQVQTPTLATQAVFAVPFVLAFWFVATIATINEARQLAVIGLVQIAILTMLGTRIYRIILFPAWFLFFLVPVGQYLIPPMQRFATMFTDVGLTLLGIVHYTEGTVIEITAGLFEIAEACAGLRFLIATVTLGVLFAHLAYRKWWKIGAFLAACVVIPLIANGFRCIGIIALAHATNNAVAVEADHIIYGWGFNVFVLMIVFFIGSRFRDTPAEPRRIVEAGARPVPPFALAASAIAVALMFSAGPALAYWIENRSVAINSLALEIPFALEGWSVLPAAETWRPIYANPDQQLNASLVPEASSTPAVDVAIVYYGRIREGQLIASTNQLWDGEKWRAVERARVVAELGPETIELNEALIRSVAERRLVWSSYWMDRRFTTSGLTIKLLQLKAAFTGHEASALIAFSTPIDGAVEEARARLKKALASFGDLSKYLAAEGRDDIKKVSSD